MEYFVVAGGSPLAGEVHIAGAKNVALKAFVASLLTDEEITLHNVPLITDVFFMLDVLKSLGVSVRIEGNSVRIRNGHMKKSTVPLEVGARLRTSSLVLGPMLARIGKARIPNPGGCRIGARPIDRHIEGLMKMGASIAYHSEDGYFYASAKRLHGTVFTFPKNTHTGTETLMLAAVLAEGETVLKNAAEEVEIDDLIGLLRAMGADIRRRAPREIVIRGVGALHGATYTIMPDRNEEVTFAIAAAVTGGNITVRQSVRGHLGAFLSAFQKAGGRAEIIDETSTRYSQPGPIRPTDIVTRIHPGFMTDWQGPWALYMTQANGISTVHETVFESRFSYVSELRKMGSSIDFFDPPVDDPESFYNFNWGDRIEGYHQAIRISGPTQFHNAVLVMEDLRAGATLLLAALTAHGESYIHGIEQIDRGYERIEERLCALGAKIIRKREEKL
ncbi:UDP-N-acetylglucosamine 1-carboxyvinyltransferase [Candidatus Gottesmanbacteria bacterium]|nr:UDP-N-acetylglucosamine 1-carboxyvinyltransferase [Candidatus Gottesmanbacteria bacterium]